MNVTAVIADLLACNDHPDPRAVQDGSQLIYGVDAALDGEVLTMTLTFQSGSSYCCGEWECHLPLFPENRWVRLRQAFAAHHVPTPARFQLHLTCVIESGALFYDLSRPDADHSGRYALKPADEYVYQATCTEACTTEDGQA